MSVIRRGIGNKPPPGYKRPQRIFQGVLRRSHNADIITFELRLFRFIELEFVVTIPEEGRTKAPVYMRVWVDSSLEDKPGSIVIE